MKLNESKIKSLKPKLKPYKMGDGNGLYLFIKPTGRKYWRMKYFYGGKEKVLSIGPYAADAHVIRDTIGCESIGTFMMVENFKSAGDDVAAKKFMSYEMQTGSCRKIKKGTRIIFYHLVDYTDGDYGSYTKVRRAGDTRVWVVDKCSLDGRDPDLARFPKYVTPEKPCEN